MSVAAQRRARRSRRGLQVLSELRPARRELAWWIPALLALAYGALLLVHFGTVIDSIYRDSDAAAATVLAELAPHASSGSTIVLGDHPWYEEFLILLATRGLPLHRELWLAGPLALCAAGLGLLAWSARRATGTWPAVLAASALVFVGPLGRHIFLTWNTHGLAVLHSVILLAVLVWIASAAGTVPRARLAVAALLLGLIGALPVASDRLFLLWGVAPFVVAATALAWRAPARTGWPVLTFALGSTAVMLVAGAALGALMRSHGVRAYTVNYTFVAADQIGHNIALLLRSLAVIAGGDFFGTAITGTSVPVLIAGAMVLTAAAVVAARMYRWTRVLVSTPRMLGIEPGFATGPTLAGADGRAAARLVYFTFWTSCLLLGIAVYAGTSAPVDVTDARYLLGPYVAIGALLPALALRGRGSRIALAAAVSVFACGSIYELQRHPSDPTSAPDASAAHALAAFMKSQHISVAYGSFWAALDLMWQSNLNVKVYPVHNCTPRQPQLCRDGIAVISSWYRPRARARSVLIVDPASAGLSVVDRSLGPPSRTATIAGMTLYVYPYDIASDFR
jgi:hypothetical protein